jgi:general secretion pathway protein M
MRLQAKRAASAAARQERDDAGDSKALGARIATRVTAPIATHIAALSPREQSWVAGATVVVLLALVISVGVLPAWRSLQQGPARQQAVNAQVARVAQLEAQARVLKSRPVWSGAEAAARLQASSAGLAAPTGVSSTPGSAAGSAASSAVGSATGSATTEPLQLSLSPQQASATLRALPAETLAVWLAAAREQAHAVPTQARLTREAGDPGGPSGAAGAESADRWSGTLVMRLPP